MISGWAINSCLAQAALPHHILLYADLQKAVPVVSPPGPAHHPTENGSDPPDLKYFCWSSEILTFPKIQISKIL